jgi:hypothetical protein
MAIAAIAGGALAFCLMVAGSPWLVLFSQP